MATLHELGKAVRDRRIEMGLTQATLARISGLSRQTISELENGAIGDLGVTRAERLADVLGLALRVDVPQSARKSALRSKARTSPLELAARTASVSYRDAYTPSRLVSVLKVGVADPSRDAPYIHALLDDAPVSLLASVAETMHEKTGAQREDVWKTYRRLARQVKSHRDLWL